MAALLPEASFMFSRNRRYPLVLISLLLLASLPLAFAQHAALAQGAASASDLPQHPAFAYPQAKKVEQVDDYHGVKVTDPYRWLEDTDSAETAAWVQAENKITFGYLEQIPERALIQKRLTTLWNFERYTTPFKEGGRYFFSKNNGLQNQSVLLTVDKLDGEPKVLIDPNTMSADGTVAIGGLAASHDGKLMAYSISVSGSDWREVKVRNVETGEDLPDDLKWVKFSGMSWTRDGQGFFYNRYAEPKEAALRSVNLFPRMFFHKLGTSQTDDVLVYERPDKGDIMFNGEVTDDGHYLVINLTKPDTINNALYYRDLTQKDAPVVKLLDDYDAEYDFIDNDGPVFWIRTNSKAAHYRIVAIDTRRPQPANWREIIPDVPDTISSVHVLDDKFVVNYMKDARSVVKVFDLKGKFLREVALPGIGTAAGFNGKRTDKETFYAYTSYTTPSTIYRYDLVTA